MLGPLHKRAPLATFLHIESRLNEMELSLARGKQPSLRWTSTSLTYRLPKPIVADYFARIRRAMIHCLQKHQIPVEMHRVSLRRSFQTGANFPGVAVTELGPDGGEPDPQSAPLGKPTAAADCPSACPKHRLFISQALTVLSRNG